MEDDFGKPAANEPQPLSQYVFRENFAADDETTHLQVQQRVAYALALDAQQEAKFLQVQLDGFVPDGGINRAAGSDGGPTMINSFVQPVADTLTGSVDGLPGIMDALAQAVQTMRRGGQIGYDFSRLRPKGAKVTGTSEQASGPLAYLALFDRACVSLDRAGAQRPEQLAILRIDHPDVVEFIDAKKQFDLASLGLDQQENEQLRALARTKPDFGRAFETAFATLRNFNTSVALTDEFMEAVANDRMFNLVHVAEPTFQAPSAQCADGVTRYVYRTVCARDLWARIVRNANKYGAPGVVYLNTINKANSLWYVEHIEASSAGGEQPLPAYGCGCVGSPNLTRFVLEPLTANARFDFLAFARAVAGGVEMLDRVLDVTKWPLPQQAAEAAAKRRIGLGCFGLADAMAMLGLRYGSPESAQFAGDVARTARDAAYRASVELAKQFGPFPLFDSDQYLKAGTFASTLPQEIQDDIRAYGIRNSHLLAIAPAHAVAMGFGENASAGVEPILSLTAIREVPAGNGGRPQRLEADAYALRVLKQLHGMPPTVPSLVTVQELSAEDQLTIAAAVAPYVDAAIGTTIYVRSDLPFEQLAAIYMLAWRLGLKGLSVRKS